MEQDTLHFENAIYMLFLERSNIIASFVEFPKFPEKTSFTPAIWVLSDEVKSRIRIQDIFTLKVLCRVCSTQDKISLHLLWST